MKTNMKYLALTMVAVLFTSSLSVASVRVILRSDYGKGKGALSTGYHQIADRVSALNKFSLSMAGESDMVYQETTDGSQAQILKCPTANSCAVDDNQCVLKPEFWNCQVVFESNKPELCRYFVNGMRTFTIASAVISDFAGSFILEFPDHGIGRILNLVENIDGVIENTMTAVDVLRMSCGSQGMDEIFKKENRSSLILVHEKEKEQVRDILKVFNTVNYPAPSNTMPRAAGDGLQLPLKNVILDPTQIENGFMKLK